MKASFVHNLLAVSLLSVLFACSNSKTEVPASEGAGAKDKAEGKDSEDDGEDGVGDDLGGEDDGGDGNEGGASFSGCGFKSFEDTSKTIQQSKTTATIPFKGTGGIASEYNLKVIGTLGIEGGLGGVVGTTDFSIVTADPPNSASNAQQELQKIIGTREATTVTGSELENVLKSSAWNGIHCGVIPISKLTEKTGTHTTVVEFDPPLPYFVSPFMTKARFAKEFPDQKQFSVTARVAQTSNPKTQTGATATGTVYIRPIDSESLIVENDGSQINVDATYAFRLDFDFGSFEQTSALGLNKLSTWYVKDGKYFAVSVETGVSAAPVIHYTK